MRLGSHRMCFSVQTKFKSELINNEETNGQINATYFLDQFLNWVLKNPTEDKLESISIVSVCHTASDPL